MKKHLLVIVILLLCLNMAYAEPQAAQSYAIPGTAYHFELPADWTVTETGDDPAQALLIADSGAMRLCLWLNRQNGWRMDDWKAALLEASHRNGVLTDSFADATLSERAFVSYRYQREGLRSKMYATELEAGVFLTFEFRTAGEFSAFDKRHEEIDTALGSLSCEEALK